MVWSKFRIDSKEDDPTILEEVEHKFNKTCPLDHLNLLFCVSLSTSSSIENSPNTEQKEEPEGSPLEESPAKESVEE